MEFARHGGLILDLKVLQPSVIAVRQRTSDLGVRHAWQGPKAFEALVVPSGLLLRGIVALLRQTHVKHKYVRGMIFVGKVQQREHPFDIRAAPTTSATASDICATANTLRMRLRLPPVVPREPAFN